MKKELLFMMEHESFMIKGEFSEGDIYLKTLCEDNRKFKLSESNRIKDNYIFIFIEEEKICNYLLHKIKNDNTLLDRINNNPSNKLLFMYPYDTFSNIIEQI